MEEKVRRCLAKKLIKEKETGAVFCDKLKKTAGLDFWTGRGKVWRIRNYIIKL